MGESLIHKRQGMHNTLQSSVCAEDKWDFNHHSPQQSPLEAQSQHDHNHDHALRVLVKSVQAYNTGHCNYEGEKQLAQDCGKGKAKWLWGGA